MDNGLKKLTIDLNNNLDGDPHKPLVAFEKIFSLNISEGERVQVIQDNEAWIGSVFHQNKDNETYWYVHIDPSSWVDLEFPRFPSFRRMTSEQAKNHFDWFNSRIEENLQIFFNTYSNFGGKSPLDYTPDSLMDAWRWFLLKMDEVREFYNDDIPQHWNKNDMWITNNAEWTRHMIGIREAKYSYGMYEMTMDIAIYFGEVCIRNLEGLNWAYHNSQKDKNRPLLIGNSLIVNPFKLVFVLEGQYRSVDTLVSSYREIANLNKVTNDKLLVATGDELA